MKRLSVLSVLLFVVSVVVASAGEVPGEDATMEQKYAYITRYLPGGSEYQEPVRGAHAVVADQYDEGFVWHPTLHWAPLGISRSYREPAGRGKQNYLPFALGATVFTHRLDGGRLYLNGVSVGWAVGNSDPTSDWAGTIQISYIPVSIHVWDRLTVGPTLGTAEITGRTWLRWKGFKTVGLQVAVCMTGCD